MLNVPGYQVLTQIYESGASFIYRGYNLLDHQPVILKLIKPEYPTLTELSRYKQEYEMTCSLDVDGVIKAYDLKYYQNKPLIVLEDFGGESLAILSQSHRWTLIEFLRLAIRLADILGKIHQNNIIHKDINPSNIVFNPTTGQLKIIDFGIATFLSRENPTFKNPEGLEGTLPYMSPEQTGRMNRSLDYRSDFYSLGATFYELLCDRRPFVTSDAMELVHCHIAKTPVSPHDIDPKIPRIITEIVMKLLEKTAESRYQSAYGLKADLQNCLRQWEKQGQIFSFPLGSQDISERFQVSQKLYGREREIATLWAAFEKISGQNSAQITWIRPVLESERNDSESYQPFHLKQASSIELMLVTGYSGIGKSALVQELYKPITRQRGYFIAGKFDQLQRNVPYSAIVQAFQSLVRQLLSESELQLRKWREKLLTTLGSNGQLIIDVIPEVELIIGTQPPIQPLEPLEAQNRFNLVLQNFVRVFCDRAHPLVIFLDDLQWADAASLQLLQAIVTDEQTQYLLVIGAYRDNEVSPIHPLMITLDTLKKEGLTINKIILHPLSFDELTHLIADTLSQDILRVKPLAELIGRKTGGNPFFVNEFLKTLYRDKLLTFDSQQGNWQWGIAEIEKKAIAENVIDLTITQLRKLPVATQQALELAACIGNQFDLKTLAIIHEKSIIDTFADLLMAIDQGIIVPTSPLEPLNPDLLNSRLLILNYQFLHDRVQQAAYALIDQEQKKGVHLQIGRLLLKKTGLEEQSEKIFDIIEQLDRGWELITDETEKITLAQLNLKAGKKAKEATAYRSAREYLTIGKNLLSETSWQDHYSLSFNLHKELAEVEYLNGNFERSESLIKLSLAQASSVIEKAELYHLLIVQYATSARYEEAIKAGRIGLKMFNIDLPESDLQTALMAEISQINQQLGSQPISDLFEHPQISLPTIKAAIKLLDALDSSTYLINTVLFALTSAKQVNLFLKYGNVPESNKGYSDYGIVVSSILGDYRSGYEFKVLAWQLSGKFNNYVHKCKISILCYWLDCWVKPIRLNEKYHKEGYKVGLDSGELQYAGYNLAYLLFTQFHRGRNLEKILEQFSHCLRFNQKTKNQLSIDLLEAFQLSLLTLSGLNQESLDSNKFESNPSQAHWVSPVSVSDAARCYYYIFKCQTHYIYAQFNQAFVCATEAEKLLESIKGQYLIAEHNFYFSLGLAALYSSVSQATQKEYWEKIVTYQKQMKNWADNCPENFLHKYLLIAAEMARISGQDSVAIDLYDRAIEAAREHEFSHEEAIANEVAARFWLRKHKQAFTRIYLEQAYYGYQLWGAIPKVEALEVQYPELLIRPSAAMKLDIQDTSTSGKSSTAVLDLATVIKSSQAIASEIVLENLLDRLIKTVMENAGAQKAFLLLRSHADIEDNHWVIEAQADIDAENTTLLSSIPIDSQITNGNPSLVSKGIVNYVARTQESVVLDNSTQEGQFIHDYHIITTQPKSIICIPLLHQSKVNGILYLENNLTTGAFTPERVEILRILAAQAAISIENSRLYQQLEGYSLTLEMKVEARTQELQQKNQELASTLKQLKATQAQIIAQEKLASLGILTAGIAHEIKNPLNFVNNFAELSVELTQELFTEIEAQKEKLDRDTLEYIEEMLFDIRQNAEKINEHGKRADKIVRAMLMHSRGQTGSRQKTDINDLLAEAVNLAYHGMRAKDAAFAITIEENYDHTIEPIFIIPQDINRVFLNLVNNACYAAYHKKLEIEKHDQNNLQNFLPTIFITTKNLGNRVEIRIRDNGIGIPSDIIDKVFNPFFTTKPTGEGTGLGLSISHDILVQEHQGEIKIETEVGNYTEFIIILPHIIPLTPQIIDESNGH